MEDKYSISVSIVGWRFLLVQYSTSCCSHILLRAYQKFWPRYFYFKKSLAFESFIARIDSKISALQYCIYQSCFGFNSVIHFDKIYYIAVITISIRSLYSVRRNSGIFCAVYFLSFRITFYDVMFENIIFR